jgi:hypothetical protein
MFAVFSVVRKIVADHFDLSLNMRSGPSVSALREKDEAPKKHFCI